MDSGFLSLLPLCRGIFSTGSPTGHDVDTPVQISRLFGLHFLFYFAIAPIGERNRVLQFYEHSRPAPGETSGMISLSSFNTTPSFSQISAPAGSPFQCSLSCPTLHFSFPMAWQAPTFPSPPKNFHLTFFSSGPAELTVSRDS